MAKQENTVTEDQIVASETTTTATGSRTTRRSMKQKKRRRRNLLIGAGVLLVLVASAVTYYKLGTVEVAKAPERYVLTDSANPCDPFDVLEINCEAGYKHSDSVPRDQLISQYPSSGFHLVKPHGPVKLVYSSGPSESKFPDILRQDYSTVKKELYALGLEIGQVKTVEKDDLGSNRVVSASVDSGATVKSGTKINLEISAETVDLPELKGLTREQAELDLEKLGLEPQFVEETSTEAPGTVIADPTDGKVAKGTKVTVKVAKAEEVKSIKIPDVVGLKEDEAQSLIAAAGFKNIAVVKVESSKATEELVSNVVPGEGRTVRSDSNVVLVISTPEK